MQINIKQPITLLFVINAGHYAGNPLRAFDVDVFWVNLRKIPFAKVNEVAYTRAMHWMSRNAHLEFPGWFA